MIYEELYQKFGSQEAIAQAIGVSQNAVKRWKYGGGARRKNLEKIAAVLEISIGEVYERWRTEDEE